MSHSPLPWSSSGQLIVSSPVPFPNPQAQPMGKVVANLCWDFDGDNGATECRINGKELFANLDLIVAAVNNHAKLVDLLGWMVKQLQGDSGTGDDYWSQFPQYVQARELVVDLGTKHDVWSPVQEGTDWTVDIPGIARHHCEKPWTYVVRAIDRSAAIEKAIAHYRHDTDDNDIDVGHVTVSPGVPDRNCGFHWNDRRPTQDVAQP